MMRFFNQTNMRLFLCLCIIVVSISQHAVAQDANSSDNKNSSSIKKEKDLVNNSNTTRKKSETARKLTGQGQSDFKSNILLFINDEYKYIRIPGYTPDKTKVEKKNYTEPDNSGTKESIIADQGEGRKGLFGLTKKTSDILVKVSLIFFIIIIFILYRVRNNKSSRKKVLRSIPKK